MRPSRIAARLLLATTAVVFSGHSFAAGTVGSGTPASCTEAALDAALVGGGNVVFDCGASATIPITATKSISATTTLDGTGQNVTLDGGDVVRLFQTVYQVPALTPGPITFTLRRLTLRRGRAADYGAAIRLVFQEASRQTTLQIEDAVFDANVCTASGNDVGGGAIYAQGGVVNATRTLFNANRGGNGGAIGNLQARFTIIDSTFLGNATNPTAGGNGGNGGAIYVDGSSLGTLTLQRCLFQGNSAAALGGAIHTYFYGVPSALVIADSTFASNAGTTNGGAIFHMNGALTITGSTFRGNTVVGQGGALWFTNGGGGTPVAISNSTFHGNVAIGVRPNNGSTGLGGAICNNGATSLQLTHVTIVGNRADWVGGGVVGGNAANATLTRSIVAGNSASNGGNAWNIQQNCSSTLGDGGGNLQFPALNPNDANDRRCAAGVLIADPLVGPLADNGGPAVPGGSPATLRLLPGSPASNATPSPCSPALDQRGVARPQSSGCDSGAFEVESPAIAAASFYTVAPCRLVDTRGAQAPALGANAVRSFQAAGLCGVPPTAKAIAANLTVVTPGDLGDFRVFPAGYAPPPTSVLNFLPGQVRANNAIVGLAALGQFAIQNDMPPASPGFAHFVADVVGYFE